MSKITATALDRKFIEVDYKLVRKIKPDPPYPKKEMSCKFCGRKYMLSHGQLVNCKHGK